MGFCIKPALAAAVFVLSVTAHAAPEPAPEVSAAPCTPIARLPFTISTPGRYCVAHDLVLRHDPSHGPRLRAPCAIRVLADGVTIDLGGHVLEDRTNGIATNGLAIRGRNKKRLTVENGTLKNFFIGVAMVGNANEALTVERVRFEQVHYAAVHANKTKGYVIRENILASMGRGSSWYTPHAILVSGHGVIEGNLIQGVLPNVHRPSRTDTEAISVKEGHAVIERNAIANASVPEGDSWGIRVSKGATAAIANNTITNFKVPVAYGSADPPMQTDSDDDGR